MKQPDEVMDHEPTLETFHAWFGAHCERARQTALADLRARYPDMPAAEAEMLRLLERELEAIRDRWVRHLSRSTH